MLRTNFVLISLLLSIFASAHDILRINHITDRNGLSQNTVRCVMQDSKGFMWMGTINGLNRYNGKEFMVINPQENSSVSLPDTRIRYMTEDKNGYIWIRTFSNTILCYDLNLEKFIDYDPQNENKNFSHIFIASNGDVWLWGDRGCCRIQHKNGRAEVEWPEGRNLKDQSISFLFEDSDQSIWIGADKMLFRVNDNILTSISETTRFLRVHEYENKLFFITENQITEFDKQQQAFLPNHATTINNLAQSRSCLLYDGVILIATKDGLYTYDTQKQEVRSATYLFQGKTVENASFHTDNKGNIWLYNMSGVLWRHRSDNTFQPFGFIPPELLSLISQERYQIYHDSRDIIWVTTFGNGLFAIDQNEGKTYHYTTEKDLNTNYLLCVTEDTSGEIWVGTELAGLAKISLTNYPFDVFFPALDENSDRDNAVRLIYEDIDGKFWFGTRDGTLHVYDGSLRKHSTYQITGGLPFTITEDPKGQKWLGTKGGGLLIFPAKGNAAPLTYHLHDDEDQSSSSNNIYTILRDNRNRMWIASFGGGLHLAETNGKGELTFRQIRFRNKQHDMMRSMIQDRSGLIWIGTNEGVIVFNPGQIIQDKENYVALQLDMKNQQSLNNKEVRVIFEDSKGRIWLGTTGGGLNLLVRENPIGNSSFKHYNAQNGLSNEMIQSILEDDEGYIWVSTESGVSKFNPDTERFENFAFSKNRHPAIFNELSGWKKKNGEIMFGSYKGVYIFNPAKITYDTYTPPVLITRLQINGIDMKPQGEESPLTESITTTNKIVLKHNQNSFNLEYTMLNFHAPELNQYTYHLDGYKEDWNPMSRNNTASYRNVPPGSYQFKVKGSNSFGVWNDEETVLEIIIKRPWWKSGWAILLYIVASLVITFFISKLLIKIHQLNTAVEVEKQLTEYKLRFFTNISHEFRTPLTIIRGSIDSLTTQENLPLSVSNQINTLAKSSTRLLRLIDQLLEFRRLQNDKMELRLELTEARSFFYDIYLTFKELAGKNSIDYLFESNENEINVLLDRSKMDKIVYNLLSNAFKHTPQGGRIVLKLNFQPNEDTFTLSVSDTGKGIAKEQQNMLFVRFKQINYTSEGTGIGLHLTSELTKVHKGNITYQESESGGACFVVTIPVSEVNYDQEDIIINTSPTIIPDKPDYLNTLTQCTEEIENFEYSVNKSFKEYKVMVIEDEEDVREFIKNQLNTIFTVSVAANGAEGLEKIKEEQPDIIICDIMMPELNGFEVTKRLKSNFETSHIPLILLTAHSSEEHQLEGIQAGADAYITKPFSIKYLLMRVVKLIEQREKLQHKFTTEPGLTRPHITSTDRDKIFYNKLQDIIEKNLSNVDFTIDDFAQAMDYNRTTFFRKVKGLTGYPPNEYLRIVRMKKAAELLMTTTLTIAEISYKVGIEDPFYFSRCFKKQFEKSPSQYRNKL